MRGCHAEYYQEPVKGNRSSCHLIPWPQFTLAELYSFRVCFRSSRRSKSNGCTQNPSNPALLQRPNPIHSVRLVDFQVSVKFCDFVVHFAVVTLLSSIKVLSLDSHHAVRLFTRLSVRCSPFRHQATNSLSPRTSCQSFPQHIHPLVSRIVLPVDCSTCSPTDSAP